MASTDEIILKLVKTVQGMEGIDDMDDIMTQCKSNLDAKIEKARSSAVWQWSPGKAFSVISAMKQQDVLKRKRLMDIYQKVQVILEKCDEKLLNQLKAYFGFDAKEEIRKKICQLDVKEHTVLFAGEVSSGKSSLINLILGENILPVGLEAVTSTVCEIRYGETRRMLIHHKDKSSGVQEINLDEPKKNESYADQLRGILKQENGREKGSPYEKCELFWPHELLKEGVVIVDSPGVGESEAMTAAVTEYLAKAFCFVYVINSSNAGGVQPDRLVRLFNCVKKLPPGDFAFESALFVYNKWDQVESDKNVKNADEFKQYITSQLEKYWPSLDSSTQVVEFSTQNAALAQDKSYISEKFVKFMNLLKSMLLRTISAKLKAEWKWLDSILERILFYTKAFIRNAERNETPERFIKLLVVMHLIEEGNKNIIEEIEKKIKEKTEGAFKKYSDHFGSKDIEKKFKTWSKKECPSEGELWDETTSRIDVVMKQRFIGMMEEYENEEKVVWKVQESLMKRLKKHGRDIKIQIKNVEGKIIYGEQFVEYSRFNLTFGKKVIVGITSPIWVPVAMAAAVIAGLPFLGWHFWKKRSMTEEERSYCNSKANYMAQRAEAFLNSTEKDDILRKFINAQLFEIQRAFTNIKKTILAMITANKILLEQFRDESVTVIENIHYLKSINSDCSNTRGELSIIALEDVLESGVVNESLEWNKSSLLGQGAFADVYKGTVKTTAGEIVDVAVKITKDVLNKTNADQLLSEENMLRNLNHKNVVKFFGRVLHDDQDGKRVIFLTELCKENLRSFLKSNPDHIPASDRTSKAVKVMIKWAKDVASGLKYLHNRDIVHRDLKLENILVALDNSLKIADVGISKPATQITGTVAGTPIYMAPEVFESRVYDARVDIYSYGFILWEMWYGKRSFSELNEIDERKFPKKIKDGYRPSVLIESLFPPMPDMQHLIEKCWATNPKDRLNANECVSALDSLLDCLSSEPNE